MGLHVKEEEFLLLSSNPFEILISMPRSWDVDYVADGWLCRVEAEDRSGAIRGPVTATLNWFLMIMFVLYLLQSPIGWIILSSHVLHMWDVGWEQIIRIVSVPRLGLKPVGVCQQMALVLNIWTLKWLILNESVDHLYFVNKKTRLLCVLRETAVSLADSSCLCSYITTM